MDNLAQKYPSTGRMNTLGEAGSQLAAERGAPEGTKQDNWAGRSTMMICCNCMYYMPKGGGLGRCRRHAPVTQQGWPVVFTSDWCGDFKLDETKR